MAVPLTQGRSFNLSSTSNENKTVLYVKLTDSSLKAIDEYLQAKNLKRKASVSFSGNIGAINVPQKDSDAARTFDFMIQKPSNEGSFECIEQSKKLSNNLVSHGVFAQKLTVQAGDDSYQKTIEKMSIAEENSKKARAKEIKTSGQSDAKRLGKILRKLKDPRKTLPARSNTPQSNSSKRAQAAINAQPKVTPATRAALAASPNGQTSPYAGNKERNAPSPTPAMKFNLRDRIIHLLALRNYKKPELMLKLSQDGLNDKEKDLITATLEQVAQLNPRDSSYSLQRHFYLAEVKHEWPLYSDNDRQLLNKKLSTLCLNPSVNPRTISPCPSNGSQGSPPRMKKSNEGSTIPKRLSDVTDAGPPSKRVRVAHNAKRDAPRPGAQAPSVQNGVPSGADSVKPAAASSVQTLNSDMAERAAVSSDISSEPEEDDFTKKFGPIQSYEQRCQYKAVFDLEHKEHQDVYGRISPKIMKMNQLQEMIVQECEGTQRFDSLRNDIFVEYLRLKNDLEYMKDRSRYEYLLKKLDYIKKRVYEYDHSPTSHR